MVTLDDVVEVLRSRSQVPSSFGQQIALLQTGVSRAPIDPEAGAMRMLAQAPVYRMVYALAACDNPCPEFGTLEAAAYTQRRRRGELTVAIIHTFYSNPRPKQALEALKALSPKPEELFAEALLYANKFIVSCNLGRSKKYRGSPRSQ